MTAPRTASPSEAPTLRGVIDTDLHVEVPKVDALFPYLAEHWREYITQSAFKGPVDTTYPKGAPTTARTDAKPPEGPPGSSLDLTRVQVLDHLGVEVGVLNCTYAIESIHNPDSAAALASAVNDWLVGEWLEKEPRLRASIVVPSQQPEAAAKEIKRVGKHPGFVQVFLPVHSAVLYGNRIFHPIYEAAVEHDLAVALHFGGSPGNPPTPSGWPSYYVEEYAGMSQVFQSQVMNVIAEGVFDRFPDLRMILAESGWSWVPAWMWRMDKEWKGLRREIPWVRKPPSDYIRDHMRVTLQPIDVPDAEQFLNVVAHMGSDELIMFSSDYPHDHGSDLPDGLPEPLVDKILRENARSFYRL